MCTMQRPRGGYNLGCWRDGEDANVAGAGRKGRMDRDGSGEVGAYMDSEDNYTFEREKDDPRKTGDNCGEKSLKRRKGI